MSHDRVDDQDSDSEYSPFHPELDQLRPVSTLLSVENEAAVVQGKINRLMWVSVFRNSPLNNSESEMIIGEFVKEAIRAGQWKDIALRMDVDIDGSPATGTAFTLEFNRATQMMVDQGFAVVRKEGNGQQWLAPTQTLIEFVAERLKRYGPQKEEASSEDQSSE
jgi:hypothetical protein